MTEYGLIGYPLAHSFSQRFFSEKFEREHIDACYLNFEIADIGELMSIITSHPQLRGLNVTIPHKQTVMSMLDGISQEAKEIGAVNVIAITRQHDDTPTLYGYNADVVGFRDSIRPLLRSHHKKALVLGTGGASKAICYGLQRMGIEPTLVSRTPKEGMLSYDQLDAAIIDEHTVIVNCSPLGTWPNTEACPNIPYELLNARHLLYDLVYNPEKTLFLSKGEAHGATIKNGLEMLERQALASWHFWNA